MKKPDLISAISKKAMISKEQAELAILCFVDSVGETLEKGDTFSLMGFGTLKTIDKAARMWKNPGTGEEVQMEGHRSIRFVPSTLLKARIRGSGKGDTKKNQ